MWAEITGGYVHKKQNSTIYNKGEEKGESKEIPEDICSRYCGEKKVSSADITVNGLQMDDIRLYSPA